MKIKKIVVCIVILCLCTFVGCGIKGLMQPSDMEDVNRELRKQVYDILNFPYYYDDSEKILEFYKEVIAGDIDEYCFLTQAVFSSQYKRTVDSLERTYLYFGKLKDEKPTGIGVIFEYDNFYYYPIVIGNFEDGYVSGYALCFEDLLLINGYEGEYHKGEATGEGVQYTYCWIHLNEENTFSKENFLEDKEVYGYRMITDVVMPLNELTYHGEVKDGKPHGYGRTYDCEGKIRFDGTWKKGEKKEGIDYLNGQVLYKGQYKNGLYHGKGTLFDSEGNVEYKGEFRNGDIK